MANQAVDASFTEKPTSVDKLLKLNHPENQFTAIDYGLFGVMLMLSAAIGVYFGFISKKKQNNTEQYLLGGRKMKFFPIAASLIASHINAFTMLAVPSEVYAHGTEYALCIVSALLVAAALNFVYLPVFFELQLTSSFQYLEKRFNRKVRLLASSIYIFSGIIGLPAIIYMPALALSQASGLPLHLITCATSMICIFYTTVGGLKAVVWSDTLQFIMMIGGLVMVIILGVISTGGIFEVFNKAEAGGRLILFNMNPSPFVRTSFWTLTVGMSTAWVAKLGVSQCSIQRFLSVPNIDVARKSVWVFAFGLGALKLGAILLGLIVYAKYSGSGCDPLTNNQIKKLDQIVPFFVLEVANKVPGLSGLFIAGIFSAALSSISSILNTKAGIIYEDFIRHRYPDATEKRASDVMKLLVVVLGCIMLSLVFVVEHMGSIFRLNYAINGLTVGTFFGIFTIGMFSRTANTKGIVSGAIVSLLAVGTIISGAQTYLPKQPNLPLRTDKCEIPSNVTSSDDADNFFAHEELTKDIPIIFRLSFMYYALLGLVVMTAVALPTSWLTGSYREPVYFDEQLLAPFRRKKGWTKTEMPVEKHELDDLKKAAA